ncbi:hypothetical protein [Microvirga yunnanensis]|uniref:hypothetical protein n=1 Tax=Microvirga yunnanensis TaxID=2953740 RepID=UPI0021CA6EA3|nr:hypothetical protein [Microvirga sp. HBU65207]
MTESVDSFGARAAVRSHCHSEAVTHRATCLGLRSRRGDNLLDSFARFAWRGRGTPAPIYPTATLVVSGAYRYVRNPIYLALWR